MRTVRGVCGSAMGLAAALALVALGAPQAVAGGPTSVLVVSPISGESAALTVDDKDYRRLEQGLGEIRADRGSRERPPGLGIGQESRQLNVTWMAHDVRPWRVDRVYPVAPDAGKATADVWVHTSTDLESMKGYWHKAPEPARLTKLFEKLGVMGPEAEDGRQAIPPTPASPPSAAADSEAEAGAGQASEPTRGTPGDRGAGWWWAIPGVAVGAAGALLLRGSLAKRRSPLALLRARRPHEEGPRQELRDV
ncbi:hypothetical protein OG453_22430 [Streptomyces sp. NBC_01381]|uniref:hypothetical protein n=1 Tax=Streptomyces sp. NBC_01381 TaxID=2903845 RepID=UPI00225546D3|nr:hypothetical protein [Streptomyces sp. NBC_01381]MCX4669400.1 hypothetical protein [Streptomyces sp. NBC_01381]